MNKDDLPKFFRVEDLPPGFTAGAPEKPGCYVLIFTDNGGFTVSVSEVVSVDEQSAKEQGIRPGLFVLCLEDGALWELEEWGVIGYLELVGVNLARLYFADAIRANGVLIGADGDEWPDTNENEATE